MCGVTFTNPRSSATPAASSPSPRLRAPRPTAIRTCSTARLSRLALVLDLHGHAVGRRPDRLHLRPGAHVDLPAGEASRQEPGDFLVLERQKPRQRLDHGDPGPVRREDVGELDADRPRPDDHHRARQPLQPERMVGADDPLAVDRHAGETLRLRPGGQDHGPGLDGPRAARPGVDPDGARPRQLSAPGHEADLVLPEEELDALRHPLGDLTAAPEGRRVVGAEVVEAHPEVGGPLEELEDLGVPEQRLGGDAPPVQADAPRPVLLDHGRLQPELRRANGRHVAAGARAHDDDVEPLRHGWPSDCPGRPGAPAGLRAAPSGPRGSARPSPRP